MRKHLTTKTDAIDLEKQSDSSPWSSSWQAAAPWEPVERFVHDPQTTLDLSRIATWEKTMTTLFVFHCVFESRGLLSFLSFQSLLS